MTSTLKAKGCPRQWCSYFVITAKSKNQNALFFKKRLEFHSGDVLDSLGSEANEYKTFFSNISLCQVESIDFVFTLCQLSVTKALDTQTTFKGFIKPPDWESREQETGTLLLVPILTVE